MILGGAFLARHHHDPPQLPQRILQNAFKQLPPSFPEFLRLRLMMLTKLAFVHSFDCCGRGRFSFVPSHQLSSRLPTSTSFWPSPRRWRSQWEWKREITEETYQICFIICKCTVSQNQIFTITQHSLTTSQVVHSYSYPTIA